MVVNKPKVQLEEQRMAKIPAGRVPPRGEATSSLRGGASPHQFEEFNRRQDGNAKGLLQDEQIPVVGDDHFGPGAQRTSEVTVIFEVTAAALAQGRGIEETDARQQPIQYWTCIHIGFLGG